MNIREYNFAIPGNTERHIPGIAGTWPAGSRVQVDEDTKQVVKVIFGTDDELQLHVAGPLETRDIAGFDVHGNAVTDSLVVPIAVSKPNKLR